MYLKASIDNEVTLNTFSVPFEQEKKRDATDTFSHGTTRKSMDDPLKQIEPGEPIFSLTEGMAQQLPNTSQGFRLRNSGQPNHTALTQTQNVAGMGLNQYLEKGPDYKKVSQTAKGSKSRQRRQIMAKSSDLSMTAKIEASKYVTEKDQNADLYNIETRDAQRVVQRIEASQPFDDYN